VIISFSCKETKKVFEGYRSKSFGFDIQKRARRKLVQLDSASALGDLRLPPSNNLELLRGDLSGLWSIRVNNQWRIVFRWQDGNASEVRITDYH
jgi:toxin HigB-1